MGAKKSIERTFVLDDPRPLARNAPYTFFLPSAAELDALAPGDLVKLMFRGIPASEKWDSERMWVLVTEITPTSLTGTLDNTPSDLPQLKSGDVIQFQQYNVLSILFKDAGVAEKVYGKHREYWERCLVDDGVLYGDMPVGYLYREIPGTAKPEDKYPDSGWRIHADAPNDVVDGIDSQKQSYVAVGAVLNRDDSWIHLIDMPIGSAFVRDFSSGLYMPKEIPRH